MNEARNTFNTIAGKPQVTTSILCMFGIHRWQKWSDIKDVTKPGYNSIMQTIQDRYCDRCNAYNRKVIHG